MCGEEFFFLAHTVVPVRASPVPSVVRGAQGGRAPPRAAALSRLLTAPRVLVGHLEGAANEHARPMHDADRASALLLQLVPAAVW